MNRVGHVPLEKDTETKVRYEFLIIGENDGLDCLVVAT